MQEISQGRLRYFHEVVACGSVRRGREAGHGGLGGQPPDPAAGEGAGRGVVRAPLARTDADRGGGHAAGVLPRLPRAAGASGRAAAGTARHAARQRAADDQRGLHRQPDGACGRPVLHRASAHQYQRQRRLGQRGGGGRGLGRRPYRPGLQPAGGSAPALPRQPQAPGLPVDPSGPCAGAPPRAADHRRHPAVSLRADVRALRVEAGGGSVGVHRAHPPDAQPDHHRCACSSSTR